jgi:transposase InsO family protein
MPTLSDRPDFAERPAPAESSSRARALEEALTRFGAPEIFNTDQGAQFTDSDFTERLKAHGVAISMEGKRRWIDNVFIERLVAHGQVRGGVPEGLRVATSSKPRSKQCPESNPCAMAQPLW